MDMNRDTEVPKCDKGSGLLGNFPRIVVLFAVVGLLLSVAAGPFAVISIGCLFLIGFCVLAVKRCHKKARMIFVLLYLCTGSVFFVLGASAHLVFSLAGNVLFTAAIILSITSQDDRFTESTIYTGCSITLSCFALTSMLAGLLIHETLGNGALLTFFVAFFVALMAVVNLFGSGEILRISGIVKLIVLLCAGFITINLFNRITEAVRELK